LLELVEVLALVRGRNISVDRAEWTVPGSNPGAVARFSVLVQNGPVANPASYAMGTVSFSELKRAGLCIDNPPHLAPRLKKK
jgi:hypothetical protein